MNLSIGTSLATHTLARETLATEVKHHPDEDPTDAVTDALKGALDGLGESSQNLSFKIQVAMHAISESASTKSQVFKALSDAANQIIGRIA